MIMQCLHVDVSMMLMQYARKRENCMIEQGIGNVLEYVAFKVDTVFCVIKHFNYYPFNHGTFVLSISYI